MCIRYKKGAHKIKRVHTKGVHSLFAVLIGLDTVNLICFVGK